MNDEFLMRVDEELPSDERIAVKLIETKVLSEEYRAKLETLIDKLESISAISNTEILREMKDILSGLLESITSINNKYSFISEMVLKLDEKMDRTEGADINEKLDTMSKGIADILADLQASLSILNSRYDELSEMAVKSGELPLLSDTLIKVEEKTNELSVSVAELNEKVSEISGLEERFSGIPISNAEMISKLNDVYVSNSESLMNLEKKLSSISDSIEDAKSSISSLEKTDAAPELSELKEAVKSLEEKLNNVISAIESMPKPKVTKRKKARRSVRRAPRRRIMPRRARTRVNNETLDTLIVNTLNTASMNIAQLRGTTKIGEKKLRERLDVLMARGVVIRERRGRFVFYVSRAEQTMQ